MIKGIFVINNYGLVRCAKFYEKVETSLQQQLIRKIFMLVSKRPESVCNFLIGDDLPGAWGKETKLVYRNYATLCFVFACEATESELGILDLIQVFVETLDKCLESVCELDLIFHADTVHHVLDEMVLGGLVVETNINEIMSAVNGNIRLERTGVENKPKRESAQQSWSNTLSFFGR